MVSTVAEPERPLERLEIVILANGARVDHWAYHPPSGEQRLLGRHHFATAYLARQFAAMINQATGAPIIEARQ